MISKPQRNPRQPALEVTTAKDAGHWIPLSEGTHLIGRGSRASLMLRAVGVSRVHAQIRVDQQGRCFVRDLRSTNGTHINGERIGMKEHLLYDGDILSLGRILSLRIHTPEGVDDPAASYDPISGALDRRHLASCVDRVVRRACRMAAPLTMALVDIEQLAQINMTCGADTGDEVLRSLASRLQDAVGSRGLVARHEEDAFVALFQGPAEYAAQQLADALHGLHIDQGGTCVLFQASAGVSHMDPEHPCGAADLFLRAVHALQLEKEKRRA